MVDHGCLVPVCGSFEKNSHIQVRAKPSDVRLSIVCQGVSPSRAGVLVCGTGKVRFVFRVRLHRDISYCYVCIRLDTLARNDLAMITHLSNSIPSMDPVKGQTNVVIMPTTVLRRTC